jgi:Tol biopolymer transport system component
MRRTSRRPGLSPTTDHAAPRPPHARPLFEILEPRLLLAHYVAIPTACEALDLAPGAQGIMTVVNGVDDGYNSLYLGANTFNFYGNTYSTLYVSSNGLITFGYGDSQSNNSGLTYSPSEAAIAPLWDNWLTNGANDCVLYKFDDTHGDATPDRLILEWSQVRNAGLPTTGDATFQAILQLNTGSAWGDITFNYPDLDVGNPSYSNGASATVGIKDAGTQGDNRLLVSQNRYANPLVGNGQAIRFSTETSTKIQGSLWRDQDADGVREDGDTALPGWTVYLDKDGDTALPGWTVYLDKDGDGVLDEGEVSTVTDAAGAYAFAGLPPGNYPVAEILPAGWEQTTSAIARVSVAADGASVLNNLDEPPSVSGDGRYVAFASDASGLVANDTNGLYDVFVCDRLTGTVQRVSVDAEGTQGNGYSYFPSISSDGRFVAFVSNASNLVADDTNDTYDIFVYDRLTGSVQRVSVAADGAEGNCPSSDPSISDDGRYVAFSSEASNLVANDTNDSADIFVYDRLTELIQRVSVATDGTQSDGYSYSPSISGDGRYVTFCSWASNLVVADDTNEDYDVFVYDLQMRSIQRVSQATDGTQGNLGSYNPSISSDGRFVAFISYASNLVADDTNDTGDIFVFDSLEGSIQRVSVDAAGTEGNFDSLHSVISGDGQCIAFSSWASNLVAWDTNGAPDVFVVSAQGPRLVAAGPGQVISGIDFCNRPTPGYIDGRAWNDLDGDGVRNAGEPGLAGITVYLDQNGNGQIDEGETRTQTDPSGGYTLAGLAAGTYTVREAPKPGWVRTVPLGDAYTVPLAADQAVSGIDFARYLPSSISGVAFEDLDGDGVRDDGEPCLPGWTVYLDQDGDGRFDNLTERSTLTDDEGRYTFTNLACGQYDVGDVPPAHWVQTVPVSGRRIPEGRVSAATGTESNGYSDSPSISGDGRYVAFMSEADNLVADDTNNTFDVFVYDRLTGSVRRVSVGTDGTESDDYSFSPSISDDGRYVAFCSWADNLVADDTNDNVDIFVYDLQTGSIQRVSVATDGTQSDGFCYNPSISGDGRFVAFSSWADNLVPDDTNEESDVFVYDLQTGSIQRVSVNAQGEQGNSGSDEATISGNGRFVAFVSDASNLVDGDTNDWYDTFVYDRQTGAIQRVSVAANGAQGNSSSYGPSLSDDGRFVAFTSFASNLVAGDTNDDDDIFVYDRQTGSLERISAADGGGLGEFSTPTISGDGRYVAFEAWGSHWVAEDTNDNTDVFVYDRQTGSFQRLSVAANGDQGNGPSYEPSISDDGRFVVFTSLATNLVPGDTNDAGDIFINRLTSAQVVTLAAGQDLDGIDFGGYSGASVSGQAFWDMNGNGVRDAGEPASGGWTVFLDQDGNGRRDPAEASTVTDSNGRYAFTGLLAGDYRVSEVLPHGWSLTLPGDPYNVTLTFGDAQAGLDFGNAATLTAIHGRQWLDTNNNGLRDAGEPGAAGRTVELYQTGFDGQPGGGDDDFVATTATDADGFYVFADVLPGHYFVRFQTPPTSVFTLKDAGADDALDSDVDEVNGWTPVLLVPYGQGVPTWDAGLADPAEIGGLVWNDLNGNGSLDPGEPGLEGWTITLTGPISASTTTDAEGRFAFEGLATGPYTVSESVPTGWVQTSPVYATGRTEGAVTVNPGQALLNADFGNCVSAEFSGYIYASYSYYDYYPDVTVYADLDNDGQCDPGEPWTQAVVDSWEGQVYSLLVAAPGSYYIRATSSDPGWYSNSGYPVTLAPGQVVRYEPFYFGYTPPLGSITGTVWNDLDGDGTRDAGESAIAGATVIANGHSTVTDDGGAYRVNGITVYPTGSQVSVSVYPPQECNAPTLTQAVSLFPTSPDIAGVDFSWSLPGSISGEVFDDLDGSGTRDAGEPGLAGRTVYLDQDGDGQLGEGEAQTQTDPDGGYTLAGLAAGTYTVRETPRAGWVGSAPAGGAYTATLATGEEASGADFGECLPGSISGVVFEDLDGDGVRDAGEPGLAGWTVYLDQDGDGQLGPTEVSTASDATGHYLFAGLAPGHYLVAETPQAGWRQVTVASSGVASVVAFAFEDISSTGTPTLTGVDDECQYLSPTDLTRFRFTFYGTTYSDLYYSSNGLITFGAANSECDNTDLATGPADPAIAVLWDDLYIGGANSAVFWQVLGSGGDQRLIIQWNDIEYLSASNGNTITFQAVLDEATGTLQFNYLDLDNGDSSAEGRSATVGIKNAGTQDNDRLQLAFDSGPNTFVGSRQSVRIVPVPGPSVEVESGDAATGANFGNEPGSARIEGGVWNDLDGDGVREDGEPGLEGWTVYLDEDGDGQLGQDEVQTQTDANGDYALTRLFPDTYTVREVPQAGWVPSVPAGGAYTVTLAAGEEASGANFGECLPGSISGVVFGDLDGDGTRDDGEPGLSGWTVYLDQNGNGVLDEGEGEPWTISDATGGYAFNDVCPGSRTVAIEALGAAAQVVSLDAGGSVTVNFTIPAIDHIRVTPLGRIGGACFSAAMLGNFLVEGTGTELRILDVSDLNAPRIIGRYDVGAPVNDIQVNGSLIYLGTSQKGLQVVDASDPTHPALLGVCPSTLVLNQIVYADGRVYADGQWAALIFDVSDPAHPALAGSYHPTSGWVFGIASAGDMLYVADYYGKALDILDVSDPSSINVLGVYTLTAYPGAVAAIGTTVYVDFWGPPSDIIDCSDPAHPVLSGTFADGSSRLYIAGTTGYRFSGGALQLLDLSDPIHPLLNGQCSINGESGDPLFLITIAGSRVYGLNLGGRLAVFDVTTPTAPGLLASTLAPETFEAQCVETVGDIAYVTGSIVGGAAAYGLNIIDISDPASPHVLSHYETNDWATDVKIVGHTAYLGTGSGFEIVDVSDPAAPYWIGACVGYSVYQLDVVGTTAYLATPEGFVIVDASNPDNPVELGSDHTLGSCCDVHVSSHLAYVDLFQGGFRTFDVADPTNPTEIGRYEGGPDCYSYDMELAGSRLYFADFYSGIWVFDISDPGHPASLGITNFSDKGLSYAYNVDVFGSVGFVCYLSEGVAILDLSDPAHLREIGFYHSTSPEGSSDAAVSGWRLLIADWTTGLSIAMLSNDAPPTLEGIPDVSLNENGTWDHAIDLWAYASDAQTPVDDLVFSIAGNTDEGCGLSLDGNRYLDISPLYDWYGESDVAIQVSDGQFTATDTFRITVNANMAPTLSDIESAAVVYQEDSAATTITSTLTAQDADSDYMASATVWIAGNYQADQDSLSFADTAHITGTWDADVGRLTLSGLDTVAHYQAALQAVTYQNTSEDPSPLIRTVFFTLNDGSADSNLASRNIILTLLPKWLGGASDHWEDAANWANEDVPESGVVAVLKGTPTSNQPHLFQDQAVEGLDVQAAGWTVDLNGHTLVIGAGGLSLPGGATPTAKLDLGSGNLVFDYAGAGDDPLAAVQAWIKAGAGSRDFQGVYNYDGTGGITSAAAQASHLNTALGLRDNGFNLGLGSIPVMTSVDGVPVDLSSVVVKYTYYGDLDLNGKVNVDDYNLFAYYISPSHNPGPNYTTWMTGDLNYDGKIDVNDYNLFTYGYSHQQGGVLSEGELILGLPLVAEAPAPERTTSTVSVATASSAADLSATDTILDQLKKSGGSTLLAAEIGALVTSADDPQADLAVWSTADDVDAPGTQILNITPMQEDAAVLKA